MVIIGPILVAVSFSSCLGTIISGNVFGCLNDVGYLAAGGAFFVAGIITSLVGVVMPDPAPSTPATWSTPVVLAAQPGGKITCKRCGRSYDSGQFFCPSCGQRTG